MPSTLSSAAKTRVAAVAAVVMAGVTAYQEVTAGGHFTWWDVLPVTAAVFGVATTDQVDNTIGSPAAKAIVHGALSLLAAITAALTAVIGSEPSGVSLAKLAVAGLGTLAVWAYPELGPQVKVIEGDVTSGAPAPQILSTVARDVLLAAGDHSASMADLPVPTAALAPTASAAASPDRPGSPTPVTLPAPVPAALADTAPLPAADATAPTA